MKRITQLSTIALFAASLAVGCNTTTPGEQGNVLFTPDECGRLGGCNFADSIGVGGLVNVQIAGADGFSTAGIELESSDESVLLVTAIADVNGQPTWELFGVGSGTAGLLAVDGDRNAVDSIDVAVVQPTKLTMVNFIGDAVGPLTDSPDFDETWEVNLGQRVVFHTTPVNELDNPIMGRYVYDAAVDPGLTADINDTELLGAGQLDVTPTAPGPYEVVFTDDVGNTISMLLDVIETQ